MAKIFKVAKIIDPYTIVITGGKLDGVREHQRFLIYSLDGEEIYHPDTNKLLGRLEVTKGTGTIIFIHDEMCTIKSDSFKTVTPFDIQTFSNLGRIDDGIHLKVGDKKLEPFKDVKIGDYVKPI
ncbi:hypothetical protein JCM1393_25120 [Clostridium carnis]